MNEMNGIEKKEQEEVEEEETKQAASHRSYDFSFDNEQSLSNSHNVSLIPCLAKNMGNHEKSIYK